MKLTNEELKYLWKVERFLPNYAEKFTLMHKVNKELKLRGWVGNPLRKIQEIENS